MSLPCRVLGRVVLLLFTPLEAEQVSRGALFLLLLLLV
jgi:hypothetical protein